MKFRFQICAFLTSGAVGVLFASSAIASPVLYAIDDGSNSLLTIDRTNGTTSVVGNTGISSGNFGDLTYDANHNLLYWAAGRSNDNLYTLNQTTGAATLIGNTAIDDLFGLAYDTSNNVLYGASTNGNFYSINALTGAATLIGADGVYPGGLAYVAATDTLYMTALNGIGSLYTINKTTGAATLFSSGAGFINDNGITWDPLLNSFWVDDWSDQIYQYNSAFTSRTDHPTVLTLDGIAYADATAAVNVPEPITLSLFGAGLAGAFTMRRKKKAT